MLFIKGHIGCLCYPEESKKEESGSLAEIACICGLVTGGRCFCEKEGIYCCRDVRILNNWKAWWIEEETGCCFSSLRVLQFCSGHCFSKCRNVCVGITRHFDHLSNVHSPFKFRNDKGGSTVLVSAAFKFPSDYSLHSSNANAKLICRNVSITGRGYALEINVEARTDRLLAARRRNNGQAGMGVTVMFCSMTENKRTLPGCKRKLIVLQNEARKLKRLDPESAEWYNYTKKFTDSP